MLDFIRRVFDYSRYTWLAAVGALVVGCTLFVPKVESPTTPGKMVTATELTGEEQAMAAKFAAAKQTLAERQATLQAIADITGGVIAQYAPPPFGSTLAAMMAILFGGSVADQVRKNSVINSYKAANDATSTEGAKPSTGA